MEGLEKAPVGRFLRTTEKEPGADGAQGRCCSGSLVARQIVEDDHVALAQFRQVLSFSLGKNIGSGPNHHDAALVADFEDIDAFRRYVGSEKHKACVEDHALHVTAKLAAIQHEM